MQVQPQTIIVKQTPFAFLKALVVIEFFFALLPLLAAILLNLTAVYNETQLADTISYNLFTVISLTTIQVLIITFAFLWWYVPSYQIDAKRVVHLRRNLLADSELGDTQAIQETAVHKGPLGRRFDYGNVICQLPHSAKVIIKNIANPIHLEKQIQALLQPETAPDNSLNFDQPLPELIAAGEGAHLEFKSSFIWDYRRGNANKALHIPVLKNVAAFMNTSGGIVLVGVADDGDILGLEPDFKMMKKKDADGWENAFNMAFNQMIGAEFRQYVQVAFAPLAEDKQIASLRVRPSPEPVYLRANGKEDFYIKTGNASQPLSVRQATHYIQNHFSPT